MLDIKKIMYIITLNNLDSISVIGAEFKEQPLIARGFLKDLSDGKLDFSSFPDVVSENSCMWTEASYYDSDQTYSNFEHTIFIYSIEYKEYEVQLSASLNDEATFIKELTKVNEAQTVENAAALALVQYVKRPEFRLHN